MVSRIGSRSGLFSESRDSLKGDLVEKSRLIVIKTLHLSNILWCHAFSIIPDGGCDIQVNDMHPHRQSMDGDLKFLRAEHGNFVLGGPWAESVKRLTN